jgi:PKD repeat protein
MTPCPLLRARRARSVGRLLYPASLAFGLIAILTTALSPGALAGPTDEEPDGPQPLTPVLGLDPDQLDFVGCIAIGSCVEKTFELFNGVDDPESILEITYVQIAGAGYSISAGPPPPVFIPGDGTRVSYTVRYCPETGEQVPGGVTILARVANNSPRHLPLSGDANLPPVCDAGGPYLGPVGVPLAFDGSGSDDPDIGGSIFTYRWSFGDGTTGVGVRPSHVYSVPGPYPVILTLTDNCAAAAACSTVAVIQPVVNLPPICDAGGPYSGVAGVRINFDGRGSSDPDGFITGYLWDFGDGGTGVGPTPSHTYQAPSVYTVTLRVTDDRQAFSTCTDQATVGSNLPPICDPGGPYSGNPGIPVQFTGSGSSDPDGTIAAYSWSFGDGGISSLANPTHTYAVAGDYVVSLTVTDNSGAQSSCFTEATIRANMPPICDADGPYVAVVAAPITFDGTASEDPDGTIVAYRWDFGDGTTGTGSRPVHAYTAVGTYTVELCVTDDFQTTRCCETSAQILGGGSPLSPVIGVAPVELDFGVCTPVGESAEHTIEVFNGVFDPSSILHVTSAVATGPGFTLVSGPTLPLDIPGDGTRVTFTLRFTPPDPFHQAGAFTITAPGAVNSPRAVPLEGRGNRPPHCNADGPYSGVTGSPIQFNGSGSEDPGGLGLAFRWHFGDGLTSTGMNPSHTYNSFGEFSVLLEVTDNCQVATACSTLAVVDAAPACDAGGEYHGLPGQPVQFDGTGSFDPDGTIVDYAWTFGDGASGSGPTPTHTYATQGLYAVALTVTDDDGHPSSCTTFAFIDVQSPVEIAAFAAEPRPDLVDVTWRIASAIDHLGFELWRSKEGEPEAKLHEGLLHDEDGDRTCRFTDRAVNSGVRFAYTLVAIDLDGSQQRFGPIQATVPFPDLALRLGQNPAHPPLAIGAEMPRQGKLRIRILDASGRVVRELVHSDLPPGSHRVQWDGRDQRGPAAPSGVYFVVMELGAEMRREKLVLIR